MHRRKGVCRPAAAAAAAAPAGPGPGPVPAWHGDGRGGRRLPPSQPCGGRESVIAMYDLDVIEHSVQVKFEIMIKVTRDAVLQVSGLQVTFASPLMPGQGGRGPGPRPEGPKGQS
jgi:hypothetical protein